MAPVRAALFTLLLASFVVVQGLALAGRGPSAALSILSVYALFGFASFGVQHVVHATTARTRWLEAGLVLGLAAVAAGLVATGALVLRTAAQSGLLAAGLVGLTGYLRDVRAAPREDRRAARLELRDASIVPLAVMQVPFFLWATTGINPVYDAHVLAFEAALGVELSALTHRAFAALPIAGAAAAGCYYALPIGLAVVAQLQPSASLRTRVLVAALGSGVAGFVLYAVCPVVGIFPAYGDAPPGAAGAAVDAAPMHVAARVPRNGMPSLHTAWALVIALNAWRLPRRWRAALAGFAALNVWAAAGAVGHWTMDIVVAVPFAAAVQLAAIGAPAGRSRFAAAAAAAGITLAWIAGFRLGVPLDGAPPALAWTAVLLTLVGPAWLLARPRARQRVRP
jgi:hypothetical protein